MSALDFSHFKKIAQDKKCATLKHPDGHEIKIAIVNLNPALKKKLEALPLHQAEGSEEPIQPLDNESPAEADHEIANVEKEVEHTPPPAPEQPQATPAAAAAPMQAETPQQTPAAPTPQQAPETTVPIDNAVTIPTAPPTPEQEAEEKTKKNVMVGQDLSLGHIKPKTYGSLFAEKSTLGKIGTLFGLLISGAGAGLTHQPNALLAMMDKQIQNDMEAQKTDQSNKQNWYKLAYEHTRSQVLNRLSNSEEFKNATEAEREQMINHEMGADNSVSTDALNYARMAALQDQQNNINKMPPGQQRDGAQNILNNAIVLNHKQMYEDHLKDAQSKPQIGQSGGVKQNLPPAKGYAEPGVHYEVVDQNKKNEGFKKGLQYGSKAAFVKGAIPTEAHAKIDKEIEELADNRNNWADANDAFNKLAKLKNAGQVPGVNAAAHAATGLAGIIGTIAGGPVGTAAGGALGHFGGALVGETVKDYYERQRQVQVDALIQRLRNKGMAGTEAKQQAESILPKWTDNKETLPEVHYQLQQHFKAQEDNKTPSLKQYGLLSSQPKYKYEAPKFDEKKLHSGLSAAGSKALNEGAASAGVSP